MLPPPGEGIASAPWGGRASRYRRAGAGGSSRGLPNPDALSLPPAPLRKTIPSPVLPDDAPLSATDYVTEEHRSAAVSGSTTPTCRVYGDKQLFPFCCNVLTTRARVLSVTAPSAC
jgi:hypothetical protein